MSAGTTTLSTWTADKVYGDMEDLETLYIEASKAFNWVKKQKNAVTGTNTLLVAAFYDQKSKSIYASTIPRGGFRTEMVKNKNVGVIWHAHHDDVKKKKKDLGYHAEDAAYMWKEYTNPENVQDPLAFKYGQSQPQGSKIAVWGAYGSPDAIKKATGQPIASCRGCKMMATSLGVYFEDPKG
ncbi:hypothetical protein F4778DRAFT_57933 [Xylariomycetidae sp. FL2044]|nr:hypothetical protein F4778DRAFT_57933 [Xylariomycetidae sp. FL2044]